MRRSAPTACLASAALIAVLAGCSPTPPSDSAAPEQAASPISYPVPEGCPTAEQFSQEMSSELPYTAANFSLLSSQLQAPLLEGGCAYVNGNVKTSSDGQAVRFLYILYFNLGTSNRPTLADFDGWALKIGATQTEGHDFDLPGTYSGLTEAAAFASGEGTGSTWFSGGTIPEYTQGTQGIVRLWLPSDQVAKLTVEDGNSAAYDPTTALANGLKLRWEGSFDVADKDGYTANYALSGSLSPFTANVADSKPGEFEADAVSAISGSVANTTADRNASITGVGMYALYPLGSAACTNFNGISKAGGSWKQPDYCFVRIGGVVGSELAPGRNSTVQAENPPIKSGPHAEGSGALAQLNAPVAIYALFGGQRVQSTPDWTSSKGCVAPTDSIGGQAAVVMDGWPDILCG